MRLIKTYKGFKDSKFGIGRFYRSDIRKLNALRLYYDFPPNSRELFNNALDGRNALLAVLKDGKRVIGYMMYEFPCLSNDDVLWLFRIPQRITEKDSSVTGFNIGINSGESAGQTIFHCHIHLIPRRNGDTPNPRGGVRGVIPDKMGY